MVCYSNELREADEEKESSRVARYLYSKSSKPARGKIRNQITSLYAES